MKLNRQRFLILLKQNEKGLPFSYSSSNCCTKSKNKVVLRNHTTFKNDPDVCKMSRCHQLSDTLCRQQCVDQQKEGSRNHSCPHLPAPLYQVSAKCPLTKVGNPGIRVVCTGPPSSMCGEIWTGANNSGSWVALLVKRHLVDKCADVMTGADTSRS